MLTHVSMQTIAISFKKYIAITSICICKTLVCQKQ